MNRRVGLILLLCGALTCGLGLARAQSTALPSHPRPLAALQGEPGADWMAGPIGDRAELLGFGGMHGGKVVTGAPFSAVAVSETIQTFADGNHISRKTQTNLFRDSQGRVRKEVTLNLLAASGQSKSFVFINDAVAGADFILHPESKTAEKMAVRGPRGAFRGDLQDKITYRSREAGANFIKEDLGTQTIVGVSCQGTRITRTIPAGQIGNEKSITIVHESWYSADLQMMVMSKRSNPWSGETTYTLTNIQRAEPNAALFTVPSDFTVTEGHPGRHGMGGFRPAPPPPPAEN